MRILLRNGMAETVSCPFTAASFPWGITLAGKAGDSSTSAFFLLLVGWHSSDPTPSGDLTISENGQSAANAVNRHALRNDDLGGRVMKHAFDLTTRLAGSG